MKVKGAITHFVRARPKLGEHRGHKFPGVIYFKKEFVGMKVKVIRYALFLQLMKRLDMVETKLRRIRGFSQ